MRKITNPHDAFFKKVLDWPGVPADLIQLLPDFDTSLLDLDTMEEEPNSYLTEGLTEFFSDKVFRCRAKDGKTEQSVAFLLEHKSYEPVHLRLQLNFYIAARAYKQLTSKVKPVLTIAVLISHAQKKFTKKPKEADYPNVPAGLNHFILAGDFLVLDTANLTDENILKLRMSPLINALILLKHYKDKNYLTTNHERIFAFGDFYDTTEEGQAFMYSLLVYFFQIAELRPVESIALIHKLPQIMQTKARSAYEQIKLEGKIEGKLEGKIEGKIEGKLELARIVIQDYILTTPGITDLDIARRLEIELELVTKIREDLRAKGLIPQ